MKDQLLRHLNGCRLILWLLASTSSMAQGHVGHVAVKSAPKAPQGVSTDKPEAQGNEQETHLMEITTDYQLLVAPLFQRACADCHSGDTQYPWYYTIPGIKQWIREDIDEAREHIEISNGYPFQSHATALEDLIAVEKVIREETMPPWSYRLMHEQSRLNGQEKKRIIDWAKRGQKLLQDFSAPKK